jgi:hypothetical protein
MSLQPYGTLLHDGVFRLHRLPNPESLGTPLTEFNKEQLVCFFPTCDGKTIEEVRVNVRRCLEKAKRIFVSDNIYDRDIRSFFCSSSKSSDDTTKLFFIKARALVGFKQLLGPDQHNVFNMLSAAIEHMEEALKTVHDMARKMGTGYNHDMIYDDTDPRSKQVWMSYDRYVVESKEKKLCSYTPSVRSPYVNLVCGATLTPDDIGAETNPINWRCLACHGKEPWMKRTMVKGVWVPVDMPATYNKLQLLRKKSIPKPKVDEKSTPVVQKPPSPPKVVLKVDEKSTPVVQKKQPSPPKVVLKVDEKSTPVVQKPPSPSKKLVCPPETETGKLEGNGIDTFAVKGSGKYTDDLIIYTGDVKTLTVADGVSAYALPKQVLVKILIEEVTSTLRHNDKDKSVSNSEKISYLEKNGYKINSWHQVRSIDDYYYWATQSKADLIERLRRFYKDEGTLFASLEDAK